MAAYRCAILDDYQNVALSLADYSKVPEVEFKVFNEPVRRTDEDTIRDVKDFDIVVMMRERTAFPRKVIEALPKLKLLITTGMANARSTPRPAPSATSWCAARRASATRPPASRSA